MFLAVLTQLLLQEERCSKMFVDAHSNHFCFTRGLNGFVNRTSSSGFYYITKCFTVTQNSVSMLLQILFGMIHCLLGGVQLSILIAHKQATEACSIWSVLL